MQKSKPKKSMYQRCKHMKKRTGMDNMVYCICTSKKGGNDKYIPQFGQISRWFDSYVMGCQSGTEAIFNWWPLCVQGKDPLTGRTPSKCAYY
jgi:hypothetical protein